MALYTHSVYTHQLTKGVVFKRHENVPGMRILTGCYGQRILGSISFGAQPTQGSKRLKVLASA